MKKLFIFKWGRLSLRAFLFTLLLGAAGLTNAMAQTFTVGNLNYSINDDGASVTLTGHVNGQDATGRLEIPESVELYGIDYPVTRIASYAFSWHEGFTGDLLIPNSVTEILWGAFDHCTGLSGKLTIGNSVTKLDDYCFAYCGFTGTVTIPSTVNQIGDEVFRSCSNLTTLNFNAEYAEYGYCGSGGDNWLYGTSISTINIGENVRYIPNDFLNNISDNLSIDHVTLPESVTHIGSNAFYNFTGTVNIPSHVEEIYGGAFSNCTGLSGNLTFPETLVRIDGYAFYNCTNLTGSLSIPNNVFFIGEYAFGGCSGLSGTLTLGTSLEQIDQYAFFGTMDNITAIHCYAMTPPWLGSSVFLGSSAEMPVIVPCGTTEDYQNASGWNMFANIIESDPCQWLIQATARPDFGGTISGAGMYEEGSTCTLTATAASGWTFLRWTEDGQVVSTDATYSFTVDGNRTLMAQFTSPDYITFADPIVENICLNWWDNNGDGLLSLEEAAAVTDLSYAFNYNDNITSFDELQYFTGLTSIRYYAFYSCDNLASVVLPESLTTIEYAAFQDCYSLSSITIPEGVTYIDGYAFAECYALTSLNVLPAAPPQISDDCPFCYMDLNNVTVTVHCGTMESYQNTYVWNWFSNYQEPDDCIYDITVTLNIDEAGTVRGTGAYQNGSTCTLRAIPNAEYAFEKWTENGEEVSTDATYEFTVTGNRNLVANFRSLWHDVMVKIIPEGSGTVGIANRDNNRDDQWYYYDNGEYTSGIGTGGGNFSWGIMFPAGSYSGNMITKVSAFDHEQMYGTVTIYNDGENAPSNPVGSMDVRFTGCDSFVEFVFDNPLEIDPSKNVWVVFYHNYGGNYPAACCSNTGDPNGRWVSVDGTTWEDLTGYGLNYTFMIRAFIETPQIIGNYLEGETCSLVATPNDGWVFNNWMKEGQIISTEPEFDYTVSTSNLLVARFRTANPIIFADPNVEAICVSNWDTDHDGFLSYPEAAAVTNLNYAFNYNDYITSFDELQYFTGLTYINESEFSNCYALASIIIPEGVTYIGYYAFSGCYGLESVTFPSTLETIDEWAFYACVGLTNVEFPSSVTTIGDGAFQECSNLASLALPESLEYIGNQAFYICSNLTGTLEIPASVTYIGSHAFRECSSLTSLVLSENVVTIGNNAFRNCSGLRGEITLPESLEYIGERAFYGCDGISTVNYNAINCTFMGSADEPVFYDCAFTRLNIGENVENIPNFAFKRCFLLTEMNVAAVVPPTIYSSTFGMVSRSIPVSVPYGSGDVYRTTQYWEEFFNITEDYTPTPYAYHWNLDIHQFESNMTVIGVIQINGVEQESNALEIGAFVGDECRGRQMLAYYPMADRYLVFLMLYGDEEDASVFSFRLYDHETQAELMMSCATQITFEVNGTLGEPDDPYVFDFSSGQSSSFALGWNWWSSYIEADDLMDQMKAGLGADGKQIKSQTKFTMNYGTTWMGQLNSIENDKTYMIQTLAPCAVELSGTPVNPADYPITLNTGWKWIGYPCTTTMSVNEALAGITPTAGDQIKAQGSFATYYNNIGWMGTLKKLNPGVGYMYKLNGASQTLVFPSGSRNMEVEENITAEGNHWVPDVYAFPSNMTIMAVVELDNVELASDNYELAAFANGEVRGSARLMYVEPLNRWMAFLTISGDEAADLYFGLNDVETGMECFDNSDAIVYATDASLGSFDEPMVIRFRGTTSLNDLESSLQVYPNPVARGERVSINLPVDSKVRVEVVNALGAVISTETSTMAPAAINTPTNSGVYTLRITVDGKGTYYRKLVVE